MRGKIKFWVHKMVKLAQNTHFHAKWSSIYYQEVNGSRKTGLFIIIASERNSTEKLERKLKVYILLTGAPSSLRETELKDNAYQIHFLIHWWIRIPYAKKLVVIASSHSLSLLPLTHKIRVLRKQANLNWRERGRMNGLLAGPLLYKY